MPEVCAQRSHEGVASVGMEPDWKDASKAIKETYKKAGDRVRTGNIQLGRLTLYQLSYARVNQILADPR